MMEWFFHGANMLLLGSCLAALWISNRERLVTLSVLQVLAVLPLLAGFYLYFGGHDMPQYALQLLLFSESVFAVLWLGLCYRIGRISSEAAKEPRWFGLVQGAAGAALGVGAFYFHPGYAVFPEESLFVLEHLGLSYYYSLFLLVAILFSAWRLEVFWRALDSARRWSYKFFVLGGFTVCGALGWAASYRITYVRLVGEHFFLLAGLLLAAWFLMGYAVARHRLLNRKIFISRKIVYTFVAPTVFAVYLLGLGVVGLIMRIYGWPLPFVLYWLAVAFGGIGVAVFVLSPGLRRRVKFFISTHFYVNKYEYRDEWLALSAGLKGAETESDVVEALQQVMAGSLYASRIVIWTGDPERGYRLISSPPPLGSAIAEKQSWQNLSPDDPVVLFFSEHKYINLQQKHWIPLQAEVAEKKADLFRDLGIVLMTSMAAGDQVVGLIGLGPEFTGGIYGHDDYDLLIALGSQTAAALLAVRMAENLAEIRERRAWDRLSAFVLHDIKNAATMLSLVRANAPAHIDNPEFQEEMLEVIDDSLTRMGKVQQRLDMLKAEVTPVWAEVDLPGWLEDACVRIGRQIKGLEIGLSCPPDLRLKSDPDLLFRILENLLLNAFEAAKELPDVHPAVQVDVVPDRTNQWVSILFTDNGPGIDESLLPDALFEPLKTTREKGSGIGLWQAKQLATSLGATLRARNDAGVGACFEIRLALL